MVYTKIQCLGNSFIVFNEEDIVDEVTDTTPLSYLQTLAPILCDYGFGLGADSVLLYENRKGEHWMHVINPDSSIAEVCGNGMRSIARFLWDILEIQDEEIYINTISGRYKHTKIDDLYATANLGKPSLEKFPLNTSLVKHPFLNQKVKIDTLEFNEVSGVSMGNPHLVVMVEDIHNWDIAEVGYLLENHEYFPERTNVHLCEITDKDELTVYTWERGVGITTGCGTGASACAYVAYLNKKIGNNPVKVQMSGGVLTVTIHQDETIELEGYASITTIGEWINQIGLLIQAKNAAGLA